MFYFMNAISAQSLPSIGVLRFEKFSPAEFFSNDLNKLIPTLWESAIGHENVSEYASDLLGFNIPMNRRNIQLQIGDRGIIFQYSGPRLEEGAKALPEWAKYELIMFSIVD